VILFKHLDGLRLFGPLSVKLGTMTKVENYADVRHDDRRLQEYGVVLGQRGGTPGMSSVKKMHHAS
jgi:hypothetical protein